MATRVCPECGSQYVASVRRCIDCDAMLVDEVGPQGEATPTVATPLGAGDQIAYELDGWGNQLRVTLSGMLDLHGIAHVWEVGALVVAAPHEEAVDELIAAVEGGEGEELEADVPQVAFEIEGVSADELVALDAELIAAHIPHAWSEDGELLVPEESEDQVAEMIDAVLNPPEEDEAADGLATHAALDALYVAVDKLGKAPSDQKLVERFGAAADGLEGLSVPYGLSGAEWEAVVAQVAELRALLDGTADVAGEPASDEDGSDEGRSDEDGSDEDGSDAVADADGDADADAEPVADATSADEGSGGADEDAAGDGEAGSDDDGEPAADGEVDDAPRDRDEVARDLIGRLRTRMLDLV